MAATQFTYNPTSNQESGDRSFSGILQIQVHHARNIHNICIYENQDVYAKFSLTYDPDEALSTRVVNGGGKNPDFNDDLIMKIHQADAVMKCEIWMLSRVKNYMDDQLLGFALVPVSSVSGKGKVTQDFDLSSTDLFHSPAGTIKLSLSLITKTPADVPFADSCPATSQLLVDRQIPDDEYCMLEFPDMHIVNENRQMVSEYIARNGRCLEKPDASFLHLGALPVEDEYSMSPDGSVHNSGLLSSTMTSLSDDRNSIDSTSPDENAPTSRFIVEAKKSEEGREENEEESKRNKTKLEAEESIMQKQIVDMYMKSMQQFTESLAKMKLPMGLDKPEVDSQGDLIQNHDTKIETGAKANNNDNNNSRVFYGSRAFF